MNQKAVSVNRLIMSYLLALYCMLLPFEELLAFSFGSLLRPLGAVIMAFAFVFLIPTKFVVRRDWIWMLIWLLYSAVSGLWAQSYDWWSYFFKIYLGQVIFVFLIVHLPSSYINLNTVKKGLLIGASAAAVMLVFFPTQSAFNAEGRRTIIMLGAHMDPNILATILCIAIFCALSMFKGQLPMILKVIIIALVLLLVLGIFFTGSRGVVIALLFSVLIMILFNLIRRGRKATTMYIILGVAAAMVVLYFVLPEDLLINRFSNSTFFGMNEVVNKAHNRYTIWSYALKLFLQNPFFGYGCGNFFSAIDTVYIKCGAHNIIVLELVELGIIGSIPLFVYLVKLAVRARRSGDILLFSMLIAVFVTSLTLDTLSNKYFWVTIILVEFAIKMQEESPDSD